MIDRAAIFTSILKKNALRRDVGLPEWPVRRTYEKEVRSVAWREYIRQHSARVHAKVIAQQRARLGADFPQSAGGGVEWVWPVLLAKLFGSDFRTAFKLIA